MHHNISNKRGKYCEYCGLLYFPGLLIREIADKETYYKKILKMKKSKPVTVEKIRISNDNEKSLSPSDGHVEAFLVREEAHFLFSKKQIQVIIS